MALRSSFERETNQVMNSTWRIDDIFGSLQRCTHQIKAMCSNIDKQSSKSNTQPNILKDYHGPRVLFEDHSCVKKVILNRAKKLNSLNYEMVSQMLKNLKDYETESEYKLVILKGRGKAFCAGGDVVSVVTSMIAGHWSFGASFYKKELILDYLLATYKKPLVVLVNGIVMGGGAGLSMHASFRIVTENAVFAMPEASIGLFPDVGASHFLSRLPGYFGEYLGLTGARLNGEEMFSCGLATHFVHSKDLLQLENALHEVGSFDRATLTKLINKFVGPTYLKDDSAYRRLEVINKCFSKETCEEILSSLENELENRKEKWIVQAVNSMKSASPTSLKIFLRSIREGRAQKLEECLIREYTICSNIIRGKISNDFYEGSRAMLYDKDKKPKWEPSKLEQVSKERVDQYFNKVDDDEWTYLQLPPRLDLVDTIKAKL